MIQFLESVAAFMGTRFFAFISADGPRKGNLDRPLAPNAALGVLLKGC